MNPAFLPTPATSLPRRRTPVHTCLATRPRACLTAPTPLSARAQALIQEQVTHPLFDLGKAPAPLSKVLAAAQAGGEYVGTSELPAPDSANSLAAEAIRAHARVAIARARGVVIAEFPGIDRPGGALYPEHRARACWRDLSEFARVVAYGAACGREVFSEKGVEVMRLVYQEMQVPLDAMVRAVGVMAREIGDRVEDEDVKVEIGQRFAGLLEVLEGF